MAGWYGRNDALILRALDEFPEWLPSRVMARLDRHPGEGSCWDWGSARNRMGYGRVALPQAVAKVGRDGSVSVLTHRVVWLALVGPIPEGLVLDHDGPNGCSNRACANPAHLLAVPVRDNTSATGNSWAARKSRTTHCPKGHPLTEGNLTAESLRTGQRACLTCSRARSLERARLVAAACKHLGIPNAEYVAKYGQSRQAALSALAH